MLCAASAWDAGYARSLNVPSASSAAGRAGGEARRRYFSMGRARAHNGFAARRVLVRVCACV